MSGTLPPPPMVPTESGEMTAVIPRESLPPVSTMPGPTIEQLADAEAQVEEIERLRREAQNETETLVACPACAGCSCCRGEHLITADRCAEWMRANPQGG